MMKIICVGRNYAAHAAEMNAPKPEAPVLFLKPDTAMLRPTDDFYYPNFSKDIHYECELVFRICKNGKYVLPQFAKSYINGIGLGIDFTARDLQQKLKAEGLPWDISKGFNGAAAASPMVNVERFPNLKDIHFELKVNGETRQTGHSKDMIFSIEEVISYASQFFVLRAGDLIYTGTPAGVGPVQKGDVLEGYLEGDKILKVNIK